MISGLLGTGLAFVAAGLGVILTQGQNTWVPSNRWLAPLLFIVGGILLLWCLTIASRSRRGREERSVIQKTRGAASPAVIVETGTVNIHYGSTPVNSKDTNFGSSAVGKAIIECRARRTRVEFVPEEAWFTEKLPDGRMAALVAVRNKSSVIAKDITAVIEFTSAMDTQSVFHACWLDQPFSSIWIEPAMTRHLIVAVYSDEDGEYCTLDSQRHKLNDHAAPLIRRLDRYRHDVTVTLAINGEDTTYCFVLDLETEFKFDLTPCP